MSPPIHNENQHRIFRTRSRRLQLWLDEYMAAERAAGRRPTKKTFETKVGLPAGYLYRLLLDPSDDHHKNLQEGRARAIEKKGGKPNGWLDEDGRVVELARAPGAGEGWPFRFSRRHWDSLSDAGKVAAEAGIHAYLIGRVVLETAALDDVKRDDLPEKKRG